MQRRPPLRVVGRKRAVSNKRTNGLDRIVGHELKTTVENIVDERLSAFNGGVDKDGEKVDEAVFPTFHKVSFRLNPLSRTKPGSRSKA